MKRLIDFANQIKDKKLREKTVVILKEPQLSNPEIVYPAADFAKAPAWISAHHNYEGGLLEHTLTVAKISLELAKIFEKTYNAKISHDYLIAGALLHDLMKVFILKKSGKQWQFTGSVLDHAQFIACELYARGFPEEVVHIVAAHGGDSAAGPSPRTLEALLLYYADNLDSSFESTLHGSALQQLQLLLIPQQEVKEEENK